MEDCQILLVFLGEDGTKKARWVAGKTMSSETPVTEIEWHKDLYESIELVSPQHLVVYKVVGGTEPFNFTKIIDRFEQTSTSDTTASHLENMTVSWFQPYEHSKYVNLFERHKLEKEGRDYYVLLYLNHDGEKWVRILTDKSVGFEMSVANIKYHKGFYETQVLSTDRQVFMYKVRGVDEDLLNFTTIADFVDYTISECPFWAYLAFESIGNPSGLWPYCTGLFELNAPKHTDDKPYIILLYLDAEDHLTARYATSNAIGPETRIEDTEIPPDLYNSTTYTKKHYVTLKVLKKGPPCCGFDSILMLGQTEVCHPLDYTAQQSINSFDVDGSRHNLYRTQMRSLPEGTLSQPVMRLQFTSLSLEFTSGN
jgi:hypothetical protein